MIFDQKNFEIYFRFYFISSSVAMAIKKNIAKFLVSDSRPIMCLDEMLWHDIGVDLLPVRFLDCNLYSLWFFMAIQQIENVYKKNCNRFLRHRKEQKRRKQKQNETNKKRTRNLCSIEEIEIVEDRKRKRESWIYKYLHHIQKHLLKMQKIKEAICKLCSRCSESVSHSSSKAIYLLIKCFEWKKVRKKVNYFCFDFVCVYWRKTVIP